MKKRSLLKKSGIAGAAMLLGAIGISATGGEPDLQLGVLMTKGANSVTVSDCASGRLISLEYGNEESKNFLVGESVGFVHDPNATAGRLLAHYPDRQGCGFYHS